MTTTLQNIADAVGVSKPTVSVVINGTRSGTRVSEGMRKKILESARELNYHGNAAARALVTKKSGFVGFILSDAVVDGLENPYFAQNIAGVEMECRQRGYGLSVSVCNLSNIQDFVFPKKVGQRSVDGLVMAGYVSAAIIEQFEQYGIPFVCIGENLEMPGRIPVVSWDMNEGLFQAIHHLRDQQHRRIALAFPASPWCASVVAELKARFRKELDSGEIELMEMWLPDNRCDYALGRDIFRRWRAFSAEEKPTALVTSDQACLALLSEMDEDGYTCPDDLSLISSCDSRLCEFSRPKLTAIWRDRQGLGRIAASVLLDSLEQETSLADRSRIECLPCELVVRQSCRTLSDFVCAEDDLAPGAQVGGIGRG